MPNCAIRNDGNFRTSWPPKRMMPARAGVNPMMERMVVVLPMPLRPISETISPFLIDNDRPNSTWLRP